MTDAKRYDFPLLLISVSDRQGGQNGFFGNAVLSKDVNAPT